jgi:Ca-activated chloride channel family protein
MKALLLAVLSSAACSLSAQQPPVQSIPATAPLPVVLIPVTVTTPANKLVTGLRAEDFQVFESKHEQKIGNFSDSDAPASIGILLDLSGSMTTKLDPARESILRFIKASNQQDEFFVVGFSDHVELIQDFTRSFAEIQARLAAVRPGRRTSMLDAIQMGLTKLSSSRYDRKALLIVSDGGDNRSQISEGKVRSLVRQSDIEILVIGFINPYAAGPEEQTGRRFLNDLSENTGGRLFRVDNIPEAGTIAETASAELRNQYVIAYLPTDLTRDGKWRKVEVKVVPRSGWPPLTVHARTGYYAPLQ